LFVDRTSIRSNIVVNNKRAAPATDVRVIRDILGVRAADNLRNAELMLIVEGEEDRRALDSLLRHFSRPLKDALSNGSLALDSLLGGSNLSYKLSQARDTLCSTHTFLDHDKCGLDASAKAQRDGLLELADVTFATSLGQAESEIEDLYDESLYSAMLQNRYGVSVLSPKFRGNARWSDRARDAFKNQGKPWSDTIEAKLKADVAELVEASPGAALNQHKRAAFDALVAALEAKLNAISEAKK
jgi:hypothetical protein